MEHIKHKILIVEDDQLLQDSLTEKLEKHGFEIVRAINGEQGLEKAFFVKPDLIILDLLLPESSGIEMFDKLKADAWGKNVPVLVLSNLSGLDVVAKIQETANSAYLIKSDWDLDDIPIKVNELLAGKI